MPGDATAEADPFSPRHIAQETDLCAGYYQANIRASLLYVRLRLGRARQAIANDVDDQLDALQDGDGAAGVGRVDPRSGAVENAACRLSAPRRQ